MIKVYIKVITGYYMYTFKTGVSSPATEIALCFTLLTNFPNSPVAMSVCYAYFLSKKGGAAINELFIKFQCSSIDSTDNASI